MQISMDMDGRTPVERKANAGAAANAVEAFCAVLWLGALSGVSFLATPIKFRAPSLDLPTALEVGRVTFAAFSRVEWALCAVLLAAMAMGRPGRAHLAAAAALVALLLVQALWLLPVLDARLGAIIAGATVAASQHHIFYVLTEIAKAALLLALGVSLLRRRTGIEVRCA